MRVVVEAEVPGVPWLASAGFCLGPEDWETSVGSRMLPLGYDKLCLPHPTSWRSWSSSLGRMLVIGCGEVMPKVLCLMPVLFW